MNKTVENLLNNSGLPGPRSNLSLLYSFAHTATENEVHECLSFYNDHLENSPEEFVTSCGVVGLCILKKGNIKSLFSEIRKYASDHSWRVREAVAIGIQEIAEKNMEEIIDNLREWVDGNELEKRAVVAALCEPKLLTSKSINLEILNFLKRITATFEKIETKLSDHENSLRKTLGYGWSVLIIYLPYEGKIAFEELIKSSNKHIAWIVKENLTKNRLRKLDKKWVEKLISMV